ncbi:kinase-interacting family protein [Humulus lupulus]|uniref:kinase-interacting family protein n=1 Tax=Humulus lupulus TaxID=3486 RepID=UPI002B412445|nr:kinase-interacting family protein [Humulus lupulus]XP_062110992.1 kinase-interacting family protein [Humulus lupulus]
MQMEKATLMASNGSPPMKNLCSHSNTYPNKPSWLLSTLSDLEERMNNLAINPKEEDTFAERAESYYRKQPQLLALLQDLYSAYLTLSDRYTQSALSKNHHHRRHSSSQVSTTIDNEYYFDQQENCGTTTTTMTDQEDYSDVESSLSYDKAMFGSTSSSSSYKLEDEAIVVSELVMKNVELDILLDELGQSERRCNESSRKIELQKSLLEVLESERLILLNENARLGYRVAALVEENRGLASESIFAKRKAAELARCLVMMREDQRVSMLSRKIEDLQGQIYGLEKRNKEYYEQLSVSQKGCQLESLCQEDYDQEENIDKSKKNMDKKKNKNDVFLDGCFQMKRLNQKLMMMKKTRDQQSGGNKEKKGGWSMWGKVKSMDMFLCGVNPSSV